MGKTARIGYPGLLAACLFLTSARVSSAEIPSVPPVSFVQVPLELDLQPLFEVAESSFPAQAGHWPGWRDWHGINARYRAWRGPLLIAMQGELLRVQAHVRYQLQARKGLIGGLGLSAGCGVDEPPRQALIGAVARLDWAPDWSLHPRFHVLPTRFLDSCKVTIADIDVSPVVGTLFEQRIEATISEAMLALAPRLEHLRLEAESAWRSIQTPHALAPGLWLQVQPLGMALAPPLGAGSRAQTAIWLAFRAGLFGKPSPTVAPTELPPLIPFRPSRPGLRFNLELELDYPGISAALGERLAGQTTDIQGRKTSLEKLSLSANGEDLTLVAKLKGDLAGQLKIHARPAFDTTTQTLGLEEVDFIFDSADPHQELIADLYYSRIRARIEEEANGLLAEHTEWLRRALTATLADALPPGLTPDLSGLRISYLAIRAGKKGISLSGSAEGAMTLKASRPPGQP